MVVKMAYTNPPLIFVYLGNKLPEYVKYSMLLACETSHCDVVLLSEVALDIRKDNYKNILIQSFYDYSEFIETAKSLNFDKDFWDGFWLKTLERFFVLKQYMKCFEINKCFHAEVDNIVFNLSGLSQKLYSIGEYIFIPKPSHDIAIASLIYINNIKSIEMLCDYAKEKSNATNEMQILASFINRFPDCAKALPTDMAFNEDIDFEYISLELSGGIFDAAAIGQWLFGVDPRNIAKPIFNRFKNESVDYDIEKLRFILDKKQKRFYCENEDFGTVNIYNLHIHSKIHRKLAREGYAESLIMRSNKGVDTLIKLNLLLTLKQLVIRIKKFPEVIYDVIKK